MKKLALLLAFLIPLSLVTFAQIDDDGAQLFGSSRNLTAYNVYDFGPIENDVVQHQFIIKNTSLNSITVASFEAPEGVNVVLIDKIINPKTVGKFIITVNKDLIQAKGGFEYRIILKLEQDSVLGKTVKEVEYTILGTL
ncbi:MAG: hypothetical protein U9Q83_01475 [Bacteroidota bacterium]|nr:hypothetical protein [Bacteroidota bacterium]